METVQLKVTMRRETGKGAATRLRAQGLIPAICYGGKTEPLLLTVDPHTLRKALNPDKRTNTVLELQVQGEGAPSGPILVMIRDYQQDALRDDVRHVDFIRISGDQPIEVKVPLTFTGKALGVQMGGRLNQVFRKLPVRCLPQDIPSRIEHDVTGMDLGDMVHAKDIAVGKGITVLLAPQQTVVSLTIGRAEEEEAPKAEEVAEGEAAAVEGEGAPAEGEAAASDDAKPEGRPEGRIFGRPDRKDDRKKGKKEKGKKEKK